jgi:hypothetical protein
MKGFYIPSHFLPSRIRHVLLFWPRIGQLNPKTLGVKLLFHAKVILSMHSVSYASSRQLRGKGPGGLMEL